MKNLSKIQIAVLAAVGAFVVVSIVWQIVASRSGSSVTGETVSVPNSSSSSTVSSQASASKPAKTGSIAPTNSKVNNYNDYTTYITQLGTNQRACETLVASQYKQLYSSLIGGSYTNYYNQSNGACYMRAIGSSQQAYATTTVGHIYFRNVKTNSLIAECVDPTGKMFGDSNWSCVNKLTGATINKAAFDALIYTYTSAK